MNDNSNQSSALEEPHHSVYIPVDSLSAILISGTHCALRCSNAEAFKFLRVAGHALDLIRPFDGAHPHGLLYCEQLVLDSLLETPGGSA